MFTIHVGFKTVDKMDSTLQKRRSLVDKVTVGFETLNVGFKVLRSKGALKA